MKLRLYASTIFVVLLLTWCASAFAQVDPNLEQGLRPFGSYEGGNIDSVNLTDGNVYINSPLFDYPQRGNQRVQVSLRYNNKIFFVNQHCDPRTGDCSSNWLTNGANPGPAIRFDFGTSIGISKRIVNLTTYISAITPDGSSHQMGFTGSPGIWESVDGSGIWYNNPNGPALDRNGTSNSQDPNGNLLSQGGSPTTYTDTLGRNVTPVSSASDSSGCTGPLPLTGTSILSFPGPLGQTRMVKQCTVTLHLSTHFNQQDANGLPITEYTGNVGFLQSIVLYNGTSWTTSPAWTLQYSSDGYGDLTSITMPTGGTISYAWTTYPLCSASLTPVSRGLSQRTVNANDGTGPRTTNYTLNANVSGIPVGSSATLATDPAGNDTVHVIAFIGGACSLYEIQTKSYQGSYSTGTLLKTVTTDYQGRSSPFTSGTGINVYPIRVTTTWPNGQVSKIEHDYDSNLNITSPAMTISYGNVIETREYDYGNGAPGPLIRRTHTSYLAFSNSSYLSANLLNLVSSSTTYNGSGTQVAQTSYTYDSGTLQASNITTQHVSVTTPRGNQTSVQRWLNTTGGTLNTNASYFDTGMPYQVTDPRGNITTYSYSPTYVGAYVTQTNLPDTGSPVVHHVTSGTYDFNTGLLASFTNQNSLTTNYSYDLLGRITSATYPDGGQTTLTYTDTPLAASIEKKKKINSSLWLDSLTYFDGLARQKQTALVSDPQGTVYVDTTYDALGRVHSFSNPYRQGTDPTSSPGITTYGYDAIDRKTSESYPDGSVLTTAYCGPSTLVNDPTGKWRRSRVDGLGQLVEVDEPNAVGASVNSNGCPGTGEPIWVTTYGYDTLGNLASVLQNGSHSRSFTYDSLSRLLTANNPEVGAINYKYDSDTNCASPNSFPGLLVSKTDARSISVCWKFDALNRETVRNYSNGDPTITTTYDESNCLGISACQNIGQRTSRTDAAGSESWAYQVDAINQRSIHANQRTTNGIMKPSTYYFDLAGNLTQIVYPTNRVVNYTYDPANRPKTATDGSNGITYATDFQTVPTGCLTGAVCYTPQGTLYALSIGQATGFTGLNLTRTYNNRLQPNEFKASSSGGNAIDTTYNFLDASGHNAGHVYGITNNLDTTRSQNFTYDQLNRITSALTTSTYATSPAHCWGESYSIDAWGNLNSIAATTNSNYTGCSQESGFSSTADGNNHLLIFGYDLSGNSTSDGFVTNYQWDAESQLKSAAGVTYTYDGDGRRVSKVGSKLYWYGSGGDILAETNSSGATTAEYIFFGGQRIAMIPAGNNPTYYLEDLLGTSRVLTTNTGVVCYDADFYPYGGELAYTNTCPQNYKFEGKERDTETGNDDFGARYYSNRFGRWLSADWSAVPVPVPYANVTNPQTLNLYSMVSDDPESFADLDGHCGPKCNAFGQLWDSIKVGAAKGIHNALQVTVGNLPGIGGVGAKNIMGDELPRETPDNAVEAVSMVTAEAAMGAVVAIATTGPMAPEEAVAKGEAATEEPALTGPSEPYNRRAHYGDTPTAADKKAIGGESVDHDPSLVQRYYEGDAARGEQPGYQQTPAQRRASAQDRTRMKPSTKKAQKQQGGRMAQYSRKKKQQYGLNTNEQDPH